MKSIVSALLVCIAMGSCQTANTQRPSMQYDEKKTSLEQMERDSPLRFLKVRGKHHKNMLNRIVVEGEVTNSATIVTYKNIVLQITYLDEKGAVISKQKETLEEVVPANSSATFKLRTNHKKGLGSISLDIVGAIADK